MSQMIHPSSGISFDPHGFYRFVQVNPSDLGYQARPVTYQALTYQPKSELHITLLSKGAAEEVSGWVGDDPARREQVQSLIAQTDFSFAPLRCFYHVRRDGDQTLIQLVHMPSLRGFYQQLSTLVGKPLSVPPAHITLYTNGNPLGIGIASYQEFKRLVTGAADPADIPVPAAAPDESGLCLPPFQLIVFDVDGTLAEKYTLKLLPGVLPFFQLAFQGGCPAAPLLALATNQGGVGMRYRMEKQHWGKPKQYPTEREIEERLAGLADLLAGPARAAEMAAYASYNYRDKQGRSSPVPPGKEQDPRWREDWRKPEPGMLRQAMQDAGVNPSQTLYVGDSEDDRGAAKAAGCAFAWAAAFFDPSARQWDRCANFAQIQSAVIAPDSA